MPGLCRDCAAPAAPSAKSVRRAEGATSKKLKCVATGPLNWIGCEGAWGPLRGPMLQLASSRGADRAAGFLSLACGPRHVADQLVGALAARRHANQDIG